MSNKYTPNQRRIQVLRTPDDIMDLLHDPSLGATLESKLQGVVELNHLSVMAFNEAGKSDRVVMLLRLLIGQFDSHAVMKPAPTSEASQAREPVITPTMSTPVSEGTSTSPRQRKFPAGSIPRILNDSTQGRLVRPFPCVNTAILHTSYWRKCSHYVYLPRPTFHGPFQMLLVCKNPYPTHKLCSEPKGRTITIQTHNKQA